MGSQRIQLVAAGAAAPLTGSGKRLLMKIDLRRGGVKTLSCSASSARDRGFGIVLALHQ